MGAITDRFTFELYYIITEPVRYKFRFQRIWIFVKTYLFTSLEWSTSNLCWNMCDDKTLHCFIVLITTTLQNINYTKKNNKENNLINMDGYSLTNVHHRTSWHGAINIQATASNCRGMSKIGQVKDTMGNPNLAVGFQVKWNTIAKTHSCSYVIYIH